MSSSQLETRAELVKAAPHNADLLDFPGGAKAKVVRRKGRSERRHEREAVKQAAFTSSRPKRTPLVGRTPGQKLLLKALADEIGTFVVGPAGSGKTYLGIAHGAAMVASGALQRLVVARPTVNNGENLGFLPGKAGDKLAPWMVPLVESLDKTIGKEARTAWALSGKLSIESFQHMQGRTYDDAFVILDEAQNTTPFQIETFLTRMGENTRYIVSGDPYAQKAIEGKSGMLRALELVHGRGLPVSVVRLTTEDIVRSPAAKMWAEAFAVDHRDEEFEALLQKLCPPRARYVSLLEAAG